MSTIAYTPVEPPSRHYALHELPIDQRRGIWGMWCVIATEGMLFLCMCGAYYFLGTLKDRWSTEVPPKLLYAVILLIMLLASSFVLEWGDKQVEKGSFTAGLVVGTTANELHLPARGPVNIEVETRDVMHSFWIPALHGKVNLIPGRPNYIRLQAANAGSYTGQCAEFCGEQHAHMRLLAVVQLPSDYEGTANVFAASQPGQSLYSLATSAPPNPQAAFGTPTTFCTPNDPMIGKAVGGIIVFGGGLPLYAPNGQLVGGLGLSGDTSCTDHIIAWQVRHQLHLDAVPTGPSPDHNDNMILDFNNN